MRPTINRKMPQQTTTFHLAELQSGDVLMSPNMAKKKKKKLILNCRVGESRGSSCVMVKFTIIGNCWARGPSTIMSV